MPPEPIRPETLAGLPGRPLRGHFFRIISRHLADRPLGIEGSRLYGGRYNPKGSFGALYCGEGPAVCWPEIRKATAGRALGSCVLACLIVDLRRVLDLTDHVILQRLGLRAENLVAPEWTRTQELGRLARQAGFEALLVPSAAAPGKNLVLFLDCLNPSSSVQVLAVDPVKGQNPNIARSHGSAK